MKNILLVLVMLIALHANAQWVQTTNINGGTIYSLAVSGVNLFAGTLANGVHLSTNNGNNWVAVNNGLSSTLITCLLTSGGNLYSGGAGSGVFLSTNNGTSWTEINNGLTNKSISFLMNSENNIFAGTDIGVFLTTNNGESWNWMNNGLTNTTVKALAKSGSNIFAGTWGQGVYLSIDNGNSWAAVNDGLTNLTINTLAVSGAYLFAGTWGDGAFLSTNNGTNWSNINDGLTSKNVRALGVSGTTLFAATSGGIFLTTNNGAIWIVKNQGINLMQFFSCITFNEDYIFTGAQYGYVWRRLISEIIGIQNISAEIPLNYSLYQNYPNPFNPVTNIKFEIPKSSYVKITVYDLTGREIEILVNENLRPGAYETSWNASKYSSGIYFCKIQAGEFSETKKMVLMK